ncbi:MAG: magnesium transporter, partial [Pseudomonadota bacterium]
MESFVELLETENVQAIDLLLADAHPADIADMLESIMPSMRLEAWDHIPESAKGEVLAELGEGVFKDLTEDIDNAQLVDSIKQLDVDDIADLAADLPKETFAEVRIAVDRDTRNSLDEVLSYPEDSAGGLMDLDATVVRDDVSLEVVLRFLRLKSELPKHTDAIYLVDRDNHFTGILPIGPLLTAPVEDPVLQHVIDDPVSFNCLEDEQDIAKAFADYDLVSAPVTDNDNKLIGRITVDDVVDVIREQAEHDIMAAAGLQDEADIFAPVTETSRNRALWLGVNLITALLGSWVIGQFEGSIQELVALAVLMPIVASMGGNAGTQTLTVVIRGMSTGTISAGNVMTVLKKESLVGVLNGLLWAAVIALIAAMWYQNVHLGLVIA